LTVHLQMWVFSFGLFKGEVCNRDLTLSNGVTVACARQFPPLQSQRYFHVLF